MSNYKKHETIVEIHNELKSIETVYKAKCINWTGLTSDSKERYSEIVSLEIIKNVKLFESISQVTRTNSYYTTNHKNIKVDPVYSNRDEENFAKRITGLKFDELGIMLDYQVPLKDTNNQAGLGKIDLISYNSDAKTFSLIELKYVDNKETLLRAILESYTYYKVVDKTKLINDFMNNHQFILNKIYNQTDPNAIKVQPAVLLVPGCQAYLDLNEMEMSQRPMLKALSIVLGVRIFTLEFLLNESVL